MKRLCRLLSFVLTIAILSTLVVLPVSVTAEDSVVCKLNGDSYDNLEDAISDAASGDMIDVILDYKVKSEITINKDLTITSSNYAKLTRSNGNGLMFNVAGGSKLTLSGNLVIAGGSYSAVQVNGTLNVKEKVSFSSCTSNGDGAIYIAGGACNLYGGSFNGNDYAVYVDPSAYGLRICGSVSFGSNDWIYLSSGQYLEMKVSSGFGKLNVISHDSVAGTRIANFENGGADASAFRIKTSDPNVSLTVNGNDVVIYQEDGPVSDNVVAKIGNKEYFSLASAFDSAASGDTVVLIGNTTVSGEIAVNKNLTLISSGSHMITRASGYKIGYLFSISQGVTLNIGTSGDSITLSGGNVGATMPAVYCAGTLNMGYNTTITNHVNSNSNLFYQGVVFVASSGTFNMNGGSITSNRANDGSVMVYGGTFNMSGGSISSNIADRGGAVYINSGVFSMSGGTIQSNKATALGGAIYDNGTVSLSGSASIPGNAILTNDIYLTSGHLFKIDPEWSPSFGVLAFTPQSQSEGTKLAISSDASKSLNAALFTLTGPLADNYSPAALEQYILIGSGGGNVDPGNFTPTDSSTYVAYIGNDGFNSLLTAINAAPSGTAATIINIVADMYLSETISIPNGKNILLSVASNPLLGDSYTQRTIKRNSSFTGSFFNIAQGGTLSIAPSSGKTLILDGSGVNASAPIITDNGTLTIETGTILRGNQNKSSEALSSNNPTLGMGGGVLVGATGVFNLNGGNIETNYAARGGGVFVYDGTMYMNGGIISGNTSLFGGGVMLYNSATQDNSSMLTEFDAAGITYAPVNIEKKGYMYMVGGSISGNSALINSALSYANGQGGALYIGNGAAFEMAGGALGGNKATLGAGIYSGSPRSANESEKRIPLIMLQGAASIAATDTIYLSQVNKSFITIVGTLTAATSAAPITIGISNQKAINSSLVRYRIPAYNQEQNNLAAASGISTKIFVLESGLSELYTIQQSSGNKSLLVNTINGEDSLCYLAGRHYNGIPVYEEDKTASVKSVVVDASDTTAETSSAANQAPVQQTQAATSTSTATADTTFETEPIVQNPTPQDVTVKTPINYQPVTIHHDGCVSAQFYFSYYENMYDDITSSVAGAFPKGTKITMIDYGRDVPSYYYYEATGEEEVIEDNSLILNEAGIAHVNTVRVPLTAFLLMGQNKINYGVYTPDNQPETDEHAIATEKLLFVVDYSDCNLGEVLTLEGYHSITLSHIYTDKENNDTIIDISENLGSVRYTVSDIAESRLIIRDDNSVLTLTYTLGGASRVSEYGNGLILLELANVAFPKGTMVICEGKQYPVSEKSGKIAVALPKNEDGSVKTSGSVILEVVNNYGDAIINEKLRAVIVASYDGTHMATGATYDVESEPVSYTLNARDSWAISVLTEKGKKPRFEYPAKDEAKALSMNVIAKCNGDFIGSVTMTLQDASKDYENIKLSKLFDGYDPADVEGVEIPCGNLTMKLKAGLSRGTYRLVFTAGDMQEFVKIKIGK